MLLEQSLRNLVSIRQRLDPLSEFNWEEKKHPIFCFGSSGTHTGTSVIYTAVRLFRCSHASCVSSFLLYSKKPSRLKSSSKASQCIPKGLIS